MPAKTPNIRVTIEVEGPAEEVAAWLSKLPGGANTLTQVASSYEWDEVLADRLVARVSERAREALAVIADAVIEGDGPISFEKLQRELTVDGVQLGGIFASFGFAEKAGIPKPFETDHDRRLYSMDPSVARLIVQAIVRYHEDN
jgi:hypothetical protein